VVNHAKASNVRVFVGLVDGQAIVEVDDDGVGFEVDARTSGFGLAGMRERVYLADGELRVEPGENGTSVRARLPVSAGAQRGTLSAADQAAS
jgi:signal transduction histidine kinase